MKKNFFIAVIMTAVCLLVCGCGNEDIESDSSMPSLDSAVIEDIDSPEIVTTAKTTEKSKETTKETKTTTVTTVTKVTTAKIVSASARVTTTAIRSGETQFQQITGMQAQYEAKVPSVLTPHEPVIYTTVPSTATTTTNTTISSITETTSVSDTTTTVSDTTDISESTETTISIPPLSTDEMYFLDVKMGENAQDMIDSLGEPLNMESAPSDFYVDDVQGEDRHYYFENLEIVTCYFENNNILKEVIIRDSEYVTQRGISLGMTLADIEMIYGTEYILDSELNIVTYISDSGDDTEQFGFHIENDVIDYIIYRKILQ